MGIGSVFTGPWLPKLCFGRFSYLLSNPEQPVAAGRNCEASLPADRQGLEAQEIHGSFCSPQESIR